LELKKYYRIMFKVVEMVVNVYMDLIANTSTPIWKSRNSFYQKPNKCQKSLKNLHTKKNKRNKSNTSIH